MFVFRKIIASFSFRSFFSTIIFYRFVFKAAIPEEIHANQELFTESHAIFREEPYGGSHLFEISEAHRQFSSLPYFSTSKSFGSQKHKGKKRWLPSRKYQEFNYGSVKFEGQAVT